MSQDSERVGDLAQIVRHRSGGPNMTVNGQDGELVICVWFDGFRMQTARIPAHDLIVVPDPSPES